MRDLRELLEPVEQAVRGVLKKYDDPVGTQEIVDYCHECLDQEDFVEFFLTHPGQFRNWVIQIYKTD